MQLIVAADPEEAAVRAAAALAAVARTGGSISLAGSNTPRRGVRAARGRRRRIDWSQVHLWFGDERCVPPDDPGSNYRMAHETLISRIDIPAGNVHRMRGEDEPDAAAAAYSREIAGLALDLAAARART